MKIIKLLGLGAILANFLENNIFNLFMPQIQQFFKKKLQMVSFAF